MGIELMLFGIQQLVLPEDVSKAVFEGMKQEVTNRAKRYEAEGKAQAAEIRAKAIAARERILAFTRRRVDAVRNEADRKVSELYPGPSRSIKSCGSFWTSSRRWKSCCGLMRR